MSNDFRKCHKTAENVSTADPATVFSTVLIMNKMSNLNFGSQWIWNFSWFQG